MKLEYHGFSFFSPFRFDAWLFTEEEHEESAVSFTVLYLPFPPCLFSPSPFPFPSLPFFPFPSPKKHLPPSARSSYTTLLATFPHWFIKVASGRSDTFSYLLENCLKMTRIIFFSQRNWKRSTDKKEKGLCSEMTTAGILGEGLSAEWNAIRELFYGCLGTLWRIPPLSSSIKITIKFLWGKECDTPWKEVIGLLLSQLGTRCCWGAVKNGKCTL